ncbi:hypothetical protein OG756_15270 [Streptomyces sp. NBC_01310]|uniref:hypothetical protein n=1 Tax=unclassified Streptomyces TaxID=2593676 RepID=UPI0035B64139|nr:hypothetical protein OG756_15270 [Streptomyces sp. NBC_01310]
MRSVPIAVRAAGVAVALAAFSVVSASTALAGEEDRGRGSIAVDPDPAHPGSQVKLRVQGCEGTRGEAKSSVFVSDVDLHGRDGGRSPLYGEATISSHASPGWHSVRVRCDGHEKISGSVQISPYRHPSHHASPVWPVHAGGGGMAAELAEKGKPVTVAEKKHADDGPGLPHTVIGAILAAVATLAVAGRALALRRRRSGE